MYMSICICIVNSAELAQEMPTKFSCLLCEFKFMLTIVVAYKIVLYRIRNSVKATTLSMNV